MSAGRTAREAERCGTENPGAPRRGATSAEEREVWRCTGARLNTKPSSTSDMLKRPAMPLPGSVTVFLVPFTPVLDMMLPARREA